MNKPFQYPVCDKCIIDKCELGCAITEIDHCMCKVNGGICPLFYGKDNRNTIKLQTLYELVVMEAESR